MRFVIFGAGAIGGVIGGRLAQHGHDVVLIARGAHYEAIRDRGLRLESPDEALTLQIPVVDHPSRIAWDPQDVLLIATKTQDTEAALDDLARSSPGSLPIFCAQNTVANEPMAIRRFAEVYGVFVWCPCDFLTPGVVQVWSTPKSGTLHVGRYPSGTSPLAEAVSAAFRRSSFHSDVKPDIMAWKYRKLLSNLGNAIEALCGAEARGAGSGLMERARAEAIECLDAAGIAFIADDSEAVRREPDVKQGTINGVTRRGGSSWQSLQRRLGTIETDYLNGEIVELGNRHGIATPVNEILQRLSQQAARERWPPGILSPAEILASVEGKS